MEGDGEQAAEEGVGRVMISSSGVQAGGGGAVAGGAESA